MKNEFTLKIAKYLLGIAMLFGAVSCSENMEDVTNLLNDENVVSFSKLTSSSLNNRVAQLNELPLAGGNSVYTVTLESVVNNNDGTFTWTWSIFNPNPGNGLNGTAQNLSHWNVTLGNCVIFDNVMSGATSVDGTNYTSFTPTWQQDNALLNTCQVATGNVLKFDIGTSGNSKTYCQLTINKDVEIDTEVLAYYKSGNVTPCGTFNFPGFGCERIVVNEGCSMSQGYWFAKPDVVWPNGSVTVGGKSYNRTEGLAIWNSSNKGGISAAKSGFLQVAAIRLSGSTVLPAATVWADIAIVETYLASLPKLTAANVKTYNDSNVAAAAGRIGDWINAHHCE
jgi:hypothetical protein